MLLANGCPFCGGDALTVGFSHTFGCRSLVSTAAQNDLRAQAYGMLNHCVRHDRWFTPDQRCQECERELIAPVRPIQ